MHFTSRQFVRLGLVATTALCAASQSALAQSGDSGSRVSNKCEMKSIARVSGEKVAKLATGINISSWLRYPKPKPPNIEALSQLRRFGFKHIRLAVNGEHLMSKCVKTKEAQEQFVIEIDRAITQLFALNFSVTLDMHPGRRFQDFHKNNKTKAYEQLSYAWSILLKHFSGREPDKLFFELLNEPTTTQDVWNEQVKRLIVQIRSAAPDHTLIVGPVGDQSIHKFIRLAPYEDPNIVCAAHYYNPMAFSHQGLTWRGEHWAKFIKGFPFPAALDAPQVVTLLARLREDGHKQSIEQIEKTLDTRWNDDRVDNAFAVLDAWRKKHKRPVTVNEFGVLSWNADPVHRQRWLRAVRRSAEKRCIGWALWEYDRGFGLLLGEGAQREVDRTVIRALLKPAPKHR